MNVDDLLRAAGRAARMSPDALAVRRAYRRIEDEYARRLWSPDHIRRWDEELALLLRDECTQLLRRSGRVEAPWWQLDVAEPVRAADEDELLARRVFHRHAAAVAVGAHVLGEYPVDGWGEDRTAPVRRIDRDQAVRLESTAATLERLFEQQGGASCQATLHMVLSTSVPLLGAEGAEPTRLRFMSALAKLHNLAGWVAFDVGMILDVVRHYFGRALQLAKAAKDDLVVTHVLGRMGLIYLHIEAPRDALVMFKLGQISAQEAGCEVLVALICLHQAWAYGGLDDQERAVTLIGRMEEELSRADPGQLELLRVALSGEGSSASPLDVLVAGLERRRLHQGQLTSANSPSPCRGTPNPDGNR